MEPLCMKVDGAWTVLPYGQPVTNGDGIQASYETVGLWSDEERAAFGLFRPDPVGDPPAGKVEASRVLGGGERPRWIVTFTDAPPPPPPPPIAVYKADIWRRCTDAEATTLDAALAKQPVRLRRMFDDATLLRSDDDLFPTIQAAVAGLLGADRAATILAPSE